RAISAQRHSPKRPHEPPPDPRALQARRGGHEPPPFHDDRAGPLRPGPRQNRSRRPHYCGPRSQPVHYVEPSERSRELSHARPATVEVKQGALYAVGRSEKLTSTFGYAIASRREHWQATRNYRAVRPQSSQEAGSSITVAPHPAEQLGSSRTWARRPISRRGS